MHLCPKCQQGVRVTVKPDTDGKRERFCGRCGETIVRAQ
jgi:ribosomal protein S27AE